MEWRTVNFFKLIVLPHLLSAVKPTLKQCSTEKTRRVNNINPEVWGKEKMDGHFWHDTLIVVNGITPTP